MHKETPVRFLLKEFAGTGVVNNDDDFECHHFHWYIKRISFNQ